VIIQNYAKGTLMKVTGETTKERLANYCKNGFYKSMNLLANGCQGIGFLSGKPYGDCYDYGLHIAASLKIVSDLKDFNNGNLALWSFPALLSGAESEEDLETSISKNEGLLRTQALLKLHIQAAITAAKKISNSLDLEHLALSLIPES
jgi:hypothetical protein